jgi:hypothetical protein
MTFDNGGDIFCRLIERHPEAQENLLIDDTFAEPPV